MCLFDFSHARPYLYEDPRFDRVFVKQSCLIPLSEAKCNRVQVTRPTNMSTEEQQAEDKRSRLRPLSFSGLPTKCLSPSSAIAPIQSFPMEKWNITDVNNSPGKLQISPELVYDFTAEDLQDMGEIGRGNFGSVNKMLHIKTNTVMAVKRIRSTVDEKEQKQLLMDLDVVMRSNKCQFIVLFYGALFTEGDCWICMELMDISLDKFYRFTHQRLNEKIPESILGKMAFATVQALNYLKEKLEIIHRDVKPSNILMDRRGNIKLCDFGISGQLVDSIAKTRDAGCRPYMAPERIDPQSSARGYDIRSDVWSLGITLIEIATGKFPYPHWNSVFDQLTQVVHGDPPRLISSYSKNPTNNSSSKNGNLVQECPFSDEFVNLVNTCMQKDARQRPKYSELLLHPFLLASKAKQVDVSAYVDNTLQRIETLGLTVADLQMD